MDKRRILIFIMILIIVIIILLLALLNINSNNNTINNNLLSNNIINNIVFNNSILNNTTIEIPSHEEQQGNEPNTLDVTKDYFDIKINSVYFAIRDKANDFFETINNINTNNTNVEKLYNILGKEYINKNGITKQNLKTTFSKYANSNFNVEKIKEKIIENNICIFIVYSTINEKEEYNLAILTDETNLNYCVYPYEYIKANGINSFNVSSINGNDYNKMVYKDVNKEDLSKHHFEDYKYYALNNPEKLYKKLDYEYSQKRFGSLESFKEYIKENEYRIKNSSLKSYKFTRKDGFVEYSCIDNYGTKYTFKETTTMQYTLMLDDYTIMSQEKIEDYNGLDKQDKAKYNLTKFIQMVNTKDYDAIYNVLDNTFKNNNFKDLNTLKQYIQKNMYNLNSIELEDINDEYGYYIFECKITNIENEEENKIVTIVINLKEGTEFTMSLNLE